MSFLLMMSFSSLEKHREAVENFKKALELEPDNESYKSNLQIAEDKVKSGVAPSGGMGGMFPGMGGGHFHIFNIFIFWYFHIFGIFIYGSEITFH